MTARLEDKRYDSNNTIIIIVITHYLKDKDKNNSNFKTVPIIEYPFSFFKYLSTDFSILAPKFRSDILKEKRIQNENGPQTLHFTTLATLNH